MNIALYSYAGFACSLPSIALNFPIFPSRSHFGPDSGIIPIFGERGMAGTANANKALPAKRILPFI